MDHTNGQTQRELEIGGSGRGKRIRGLIGYLLLIAAVAGLLVFLFVRFTGSMRLAVVLVAFMMAYMLVMGYLASRRPGDRDI